MLLCALDSCCTNLPARRDIFDLNQSSKFEREKQDDVNLRRYGEKNQNVKLGKVQVLCKGKICMPSLKRPDCLKGSPSVLLNAYLTFFRRCRGGLIAGA